MSGFQNRGLNQDFEQNFFNIIVNALISGCKLMVEDCSAGKMSIPNHEEKIRTYLLENYLDNDDVRCAIGLSDIQIRFLPEVPENYNVNSHTYFGRTDIRVFSTNWFKNSRDYYIIECKRLDGTQHLNRKYVDEGICRFVGEPPKYSSFHNRNIMLGFVVKKAECSIMINAISDIHKNRLGAFIADGIVVLENEADYYLCKSTYTNKLCLNHVFYDISRIISS